MSVLLPLTAASSVKPAKSEPATPVIKLENAPATTPAVAVTKTAPKPVAPPVAAAPKAVAPKPAPAIVKPVAKPAAKAVSIDLSDAGTEIHGDAWGGGKTVDVQIDLGELNDKNFGKY